MNNKDIHLRFVSEKEAVSKLMAAGVLVELDDLDGGKRIAELPTYLLDVIGGIPNASGWHVNMRGELPEALKPYKITVSGTPYRIWD
jgi:hypothetical protein